VKSVSGTWRSEAVTCCGGCVEVLSGLAEDNRSIVRVWAGLGWAGLDSGTAGFSTRILLYGVS